MREQLHELRERMQTYGIDIYIIPTADDHESEYVGEYFFCREYLTGFTGSAGIAVVTAGEAGLWTDGRYFIQAERQIAGSGFTLYRMGEPDVPTVQAFVKSRLAEGKVLGYCGKTMNTADSRQYEAIVKECKAALCTELDLVGEIWKERPALSASQAYVLPECYSGCSSVDKLARVREEMKERGADCHLIGALDDCNYLLNIRGDDAGEFKVALSYLYIDMETAVLYIQQAALNDEVRHAMETAGVEIRPYEQVYEDVAALRNRSILLDTGSVNCALTGRLHESMREIDEKNPAMRMKAVKNETELANIRKAHIKDGVAMVRFIRWLKQEVQKPEAAVTELSASDYLDAERAKQDGFIDLSFETISAYNANAAMMHYSALTAAEGAALLQPQGFLLVDSGGHYYEGTTDVTRTIVLGALPEEWKKHYTLTLRGMLNLADAKFLYGCRGINLDILARGPLWQQGIDYRCGTGHGVGYVLSVHEPPNGFRWRQVSERLDSAVLEEGMVTTDEPGVYCEGSHGIRIENELICRKGVKNEYGQFMEFETVTYVPIDLEAIDTKYMSPYEIELLNQYHRLVFETLSPYLTDEEVVWLKENTRAI